MLSRFPKLVFLGSLLVLGAGKPAHCADAIYYLSRDSDANRLVAINPLTAEHTVVSAFAQPSGERPWENAAIYWTGVGEALLFTSTGIWRTNGANVAAELIVTFQEEVSIPDRRFVAAGEDSRYFIGDSDAILEFDVDGGVTHLYENLDVLDPWGGTIQRLNGSEVLGRPLSGGGESSLGSLPPMDGTSGVYHLLPNGYAHGATTRFENIQGPSGAPIGTYVFYEHHLLPLDVAPWSWELVAVTVCPSTVICTEVDANVFPPDLVPFPLNATHFAGFNGSNLVIKSVMDYEASLIHESIDTLSIGVADVAFLSAPVVVEDTSAGTVVRLSGVRAGRDNVGAATSVSADFRFSGSSTGNVGSGPDLIMGRSLHVSSDNTRIFIMGSSELMVVDLATGNRELRVLPYGNSTTSADLGEVSGPVVTIPTPEPTHTSPVPTTSSPTATATAPSPTQTPTPTATPDIYPEVSKVVRHLLGEGVPEDLSDSNEDSLSDAADIQALLRGGMR